MPSQVWYTHLQSQDLGGKGQGICKFKAKLDYTMSSRIAMGTLERPPSQKANTASHLKGGEKKTDS